MYYEVYIDMVFLTNLIMDYVILRILNRLLHCQSSRRRALLGALFGALGACLILIMPTDNYFPGAVLLHGITAVIMVKVGCGVRRKGMLLQAVMALYLTAFLCGGFWDVLSADGGMTLKTFLLFAAVTYAGLTCAGIFRDYYKMRKKKLYKVHISYHNKIHHMTGLYDTGNQLMDLGSHKPVSILTWQSLSGFLPEGTLKDLRMYLRTLKEPDRGEWRGLKPHFLTFQSVGNPSGMALAMTLDEMCIQGLQEMVYISQPVIAIPQEEFQLPRDYQIILNAGLLEQEV